MTRHHIFDPSALAMKGLGPKLRPPRTPDALAGMPGLAGGSEMQQGRQRGAARRVPPGGRGKLCSDCAKLQVP